VYSVAGFPLDGEAMAALGWHKGSSELEALAAGCLSPPVTAEAAVWPRVLGRVPSSFGAAGSGLEQWASLFGGGVDG
jgi:hypothetical protein